MWLGLLTKLLPRGCHTTVVLRVGLPGLTTGLHQAGTALRLGPLRGRRAGTRGWTYRGLVAGHSKRAPCKQEWQGHQRSSPQRPPPGSRDFRQPIPAGRLVDQVNTPLSTPRAQLAGRGPEAQSKALEITEAVRTPRLLHQPGLHSSQAVAGASGINTPLQGRYTRMLRLAACAAGLLGDGASSGTCRTAFWAQRCSTGSNLGSFPWILKRSRAVSQGSFPQ